ncbi:SspB family protein [Chelativorans sp. AA-79]|uniref:SspB family protein n=1 Tax=Chelativorans sp. AA-79 TaxID=3028735 RepID=UPI0023F7C515|nr:SspB family protein [Chelativorans sp. AA-79]WEX11375.1 SspB family protein [Chelativorans sp. AA-79]
MPEDRIRYDILVQEALRGVVRKVLQEVAQAGLPGNHHFFIRFLTNAPGVRISSRLKERYPEEMTIVIQYQYWDLKVSEKGFEVVLSFSDIPEKLEIPFSAIRGFYDPSASFEVEFEVKADVQAEPAEPTPLKEESAPAAAKRKPAGKSKAADEEDAEEKADGKGAEVVSLDAFRKK